MVSPFDTDDAVAEVERAVKELGFRSVFMRSNQMTDKPWHDPFYDPLWSALEEYDIPVGFHEASSSGARSRQATTSGGTSCCAACSRSRSSR